MPTSGVLPPQVQVITQTASIQDLPAFAAQSAQMKHRLGVVGVSSDSSSTTLRWQSVCDQDTRHQLFLRHLALAASSCRGLLGSTSWRPHSESTSSCRLDEHVRICWLGRHVTYVRQPIESCSSD